jgi:hypothetical protein
VREARWRTRLCGMLLYELKCVRKHLIINEIVVEAGGVELSNVLTARKLLILGTPTTARKAQLPNPLYVIVRKCFSLRRRQTPYSRPQLVSHRFGQLQREKLELTTTEKL